MVRCFGVYSTNGIQLLGEPLASPVLRIEFEYDSISHRPRNFLVIIDVYILRDDRISIC